MSSGLPHQFVMQCLDANYMGDGMLYAEIQKDDLVHCNATNEWMIWNGDFWELDAMNRYASKVEDVAQVYAEQVPEVEAQKKDAEKNGNEGLSKWLEHRIKELNDRVKRLRSPAGSDACLDYAWKRLEKPLAITGDELDQDKWIVGCQNGTIDLRTGEFRRGVREDWRTKTLGVPWPEEGWDAKCPTIDAFLWDICEDQDVVDFIWRWMGYCLTGSVKFQNFLFLAGEGRNGKGVLMELFMSLLGTYGGPIQGEMLLDQGRASSSNSHSADIVNLRGLRGVVASESDEGRRFSSSRVKLFSGGDTLTGRPPNASRYITFDPTFKINIMSNFPPHAPAGDYAFWDRMIYMLFPFKFCYNPKRSNEKKRDDDILSRLKRELSNALPRLVEAQTVAMSDGLGIPEACVTAKAGYRREEDSLQDYIDACVIEAPGNDVEASALYKSFTTWWQETKGRARVPSDSWFGRHMGKKVEKKRSKTVRYLNIAVISS